MRILITISPRLDREVLALSIHDRCADFEVLLAPPWPLVAAAKRFAPHVVVQDVDEAGWPPLASAGGTTCRVRILTAERVDATVEMGGVTSRIHDVRLGDLFGVLEDARMRVARTC